MNPLHAVIMGAVQGLAEFIPISSSAHLAILHRIFGEGPNLFFDVMLHLGTLVALVAYFWRDWLDMIQSYLALKSGKSDAASIDPAQAAKARLLLPVIYACIPGAIFGALLGHKVEDHFDKHPVAIAAAMIGLGLLLLLADRNGSKGRALCKINSKDWVSIGLAQALAIIPGVSRSGITITAGLFSGLSREAAARFSFLLGTPIVFGAAAFEVLKNRHDLHSQSMGSMLLGMLTAAIVGYFCIGFLLDYLKKRNVRVFVVYRILFGIAVIFACKLGAL